MKRNLSIALLLAFCFAFTAQAQQTGSSGTPAGAKIKIVLVGDSTVNPEGGWGPAFCAWLAPNIDCVNLARNGRSSKSYYDEGLWQNVLAQHPNYILIQFGHNDMPGKGLARETDPDTTYSANMRRYIEQARAAGAKPIIVTSLSRRNYKDGKLVEDLAAYAGAARRVAVEEGAAVIDLNAESTKLLVGMTQPQADQYDAEGHPDAAGNKGPDRTHLNDAGKAVFGRMVAVDLARACPELAPRIRVEPPRQASTKVLHVAADGTGDFITIQQAIDAAPAEGGAEIVVSPGTYREILTIEKPSIELRGSGKDAGRTVVVNNRSAALDGGTSHTATVNISGDDSVAENITIQNDFQPVGDPYPEGSQAVALRVTGDRAIFHNVRLLGHQDTLYAAQPRLHRRGPEPHLPARSAVLCRLLHRGQFRLYLRRRENGHRPFGYPQRPASGRIHHRAKQGLPAAGFGVRHLSLKAHRRPRSYARMARAAVAALLHCDLRRYRDGQSH